MGTQGDIYTQACLWHARATGVSLIKPFISNAYNVNFTLCMYIKVRSIHQSRINIHFYVINDDVAIKRINFHVHKLKTSPLIIIVVNDMISLLKT